MDNREENYPSLTQMPTFSFTVVLSAIIRFIGVIILLLGIWLGYNVVSTAWGLYKNPDNIKDISRKVKQESKVDEFGESMSKFLHAVMSDTVNEIREAKGKQIKNFPKIAPLRISYFISWFIAILLLLVIGKISMWILSEGGKLAKANTDNAELARALVKEMMRELQQEK